MNDWYDFVCTSFRSRFVGGRVHRIEAQPLNSNLRVVAESVRYFQMYLARAVNEIINPTWEVSTNFTRMTTEITGYFTMTKLTVSFLGDEDREESYKLFVNEDEYDTAAFPCEAEIMLHIMYPIRATSYSLNTLALDEVTAMAQLAKALSIRTNQFKFFFFTPCSCFPRDKERDVFTFSKEGELP